MQSFVYRALVAFPFAALLAPLLLGQGAHETCRPRTPLPRFDAFVDAYADRVQGAQLPGQTRESVRSSWLPVRRAIASGRLVLDPVAARRALSGSPDALARVVRPRCPVAVGAACAASWDCERSDWCEGGRVSGPPTGHCAPRIAIGAECTEFASCVLPRGHDSSACLPLGGAPRCHAMDVRVVNEGAPCGEPEGPSGVVTWRVCASGTSCTRGTCRPIARVSEGAACSDTEVCAPPLACDRQHCTALAAVACDREHACPPVVGSPTGCVDGHCVETRGERGAPCTVGRLDCASGLACGDDERCGDLRPLGAACGRFADAECASGCCDAPTTAGVLGTCVDC